MKAVIPKGFNLDEIIKEGRTYSWLVNNQGKLEHKDVDGKQLKKHFKYIYYFISRIIECGDDISNRHYLKQYQGYVNVTTGRDRNMAYNNFRQVIHLLVSLKLIKVVGGQKTVNYSNNKSRSADLLYFKLLINYNDTDIINIDLKTKSQKMLKYLKEQLDNIPWLNHQYHSMSKLNFDIKNAELKTRDLYKGKLIKNIQYCNYTNTLFSIEDEKYWLKYSEKCHRVYTSINNIPKKLREFIKDNDNKSLVELDYNNCNPRLLYKQIMDYITHHEIVDLELDKELEQYKEDLSDDFYEVIIERFDDNGIIIDRDTAKTLVLRHWINQATYYESNESKIMSTLYPNITKLLNKMKGKTGKTNREYFNNIMKLESYLINNLVYNEITTKHPDAIVYTIFDGIMIERKYGDELKEIMERRGLELIGIEMNVSMLQLL